jgi:hypothetical protein
MRRKNRGSKRRYQNQNNGRKRLRSYRREYRLRIKRGIAKGLSRTQARGHSRANEKPSSIKRLRPLGDRRFQRGLRLLRKNKSLGEIAKELGTSRERLTRQLKTTKAVRKRGRRWFVRDDLPRRMLIFADGIAFIIIVGNLRAASAVALFMGAVGRFLRSNDPAELASFVGKSVRDISGKVHHFETDPEKLYELAHTGSESFEDVYRYVLV